MPGLDPGIHHLRKKLFRRRRIAGSSPATTSLWHSGCLSARRSEAGILATVLADIGRRTLRAVIVRRTVVEGEGAGQRAGSVIVQVADVVGQPVGMQMIMVM